MDNKIFEKEEFNCLTKKQKQVLSEVMELSKNKSAAEAAAQIIQVIPMLEKEGKLTAEQKKAMALCIMYNMSEEEKQRAMSIFHFLGFA